MVKRVARTFARSCLIAIGLAACATDGPTAAVTPAIERVSGDGQIAPPGSALDRPLVARIRDRRGRPVRNAAVRWIADAGKITPGATTTDDFGKVTAVWELGTGSATQHATVYANGADSAEFVAFVDGNALPDRLPPRVIDLDTYEGSGQVVHPDVATGPFEGIDDAPRLAITPYPSSNPRFENPSLFVRRSREGWTVPEGVTVPTSPTPTSSGSTISMNSGCSIDG